MGKSVDILYDTIEMFQWAKDNLEIDEINNTPPVLVHKNRVEYESTIMGVEFGFDIGMTFNPDDNWDSIRDIVLRNIKIRDIDICGKYILVNNKYVWKKPYGRKYSI